MAVAPRGTTAPLYMPPDAVRQSLLVRRLMIRCPMTGLSLDTGFELTALPRVTGLQTLTDCLECGQDHAWVAEDAYLG